MLLTNNFASLPPVAAGGSQEGNNFWSKLWKLDCPPKIKQFLWRLSHNTLAVKHVLQRRGMDIDTRCYMCNRLDEDGAHHLLKCKEARKVWQELNLETVKCKLTEGTSTRHMMEMILELESRAKLKVITLLWLWWSERNTQREEGHRRSAIEVAYVAASLSDHFPTTEKTLSATAVVQRRRWRKPPEGILKLNTDGAFFNQEKSGGWGCHQKRQRPCCASRCRP